MSPQAWQDGRSGYVVVNPWQYSTATSTTANITWQPLNVHYISQASYTPPAPVAPVPDDPIEWLRGRIAEITSLVKAA